jgi:hypothetical protein
MGEEYVMAIWNRYLCDELDSRDEDFEKYILLSAYIAPTKFMWGFYAVVAVVLLLLILLFYFKPF